MYVLDLGTPSLQRDEYDVNEGAGSEDDSK